MNDPELILRIRHVIYAAAGLAFLIPGGIVLIRMGKRKKLPLILLGLICMAYPYIWGWLNASEENLEMVMIIWTALILAMIAILKYLPQWLPV